MAYNRTPSPAAEQAFMQWLSEGDDEPYHYDVWVCRDGSISLLTPGEVHFDAVTGGRTFPIPERMVYTP
jgi:hypothetical protein